MKKGEFNSEPNVVVKVALILIAELVLMLGDLRGYVRSWVWELVDDIAEWYKFPWGKYVFQMTLHYLNKIQSPPQPTGKYLQRINYNFYGFPIAIQASQGLAVTDEAILTNFKTYKSLPLCYLGIEELADPSFFKLLLGVKKNLYTQHMDAYCCLAAKKYGSTKLDLQRERGHPKKAVVDSNFFELLRVEFSKLTVRVDSPHYTFEEDVGFPLGLIEYVLGIRP
ncbi:hypothetical protein PTKIN_Ptkin11bG0100700 [Pterospermum kingtungense]